MANRTHGAELGEAQRCLASIAQALKGAPPGATAHTVHDLPNLAVAVVRAAAVEHRQRELAEDVRDRLLDILMDVWMQFSIQPAGAPPGARSSGALSTLEDVQIALAAVGRLVPAGVEGKDYWRRP